MENQSGHRIKILRTDRGGEYVSNEFINFARPMAYKSNSLRGIHLRRTMSQRERIEPLWIWRAT